MSAPVAIAFSREELVVLAQVCDVELPMLGDRPLAGLTAAARDAVLDGAARSLLARGVLVRDGGTVGVVRAAAGLLEIVSASSLRAQVIVERDGARAWHTVHAVPYAAVDTTIDQNGNHRFAPFATEDLLLHVGGLTGLLPLAGEPAAPGPTGGEVSLPYGAWRLAQQACQAGRAGEAAQVLVDAGCAGATAAVVLDVLGAAGPRAAVQIVHHPSPSRTVGGEVTWTDAGPHGTWLLPNVDQPFARLPRTGDDDVPGAPLGVGTGAAELDAVTVTLAPTTPAAILADLHAVLPGVA